MSSDQASGAVSKSIVVERGVAHVFRVWTEQIAEWWPPGHSKSRDPNTRVFIEPRPGGRFYERTPEGDEHDWGHVEVYDPLHRLDLLWYMGSGPDRPSRVSVRFVTLSDEATRIEVTHRGPELLGELWGARKGVFAGAWEAVLEALAGYVAPRLAG